VTLTHTHKGIPDTSFVTLPSFLTCNEETYHCVYDTHKVHIGDVLSGSFNTLEE
jgi:hypothetical protein